MCKVFQHMFPNNVLCIKALSHLTQKDLFHDRGASGIGPTFKDGDQKWVWRATIQVLYRSKFSAPEACFFRNLTFRAFVRRSYWLYHLSYAVTASVEITWLHQWNRFVSTKVCAIIFELQNHVFF